eukprot:386027-Pyramimonas_sp.AAC.1
MVLRTSNAISYLVHAVDSGLLGAAAQKTLNINIGDDVNLHCIVSGTSLCRWHTYKYADAHIGRIDTINSVMRAFTVDGRSTSQIG